MIEMDLNCDMGESFGNYEIGHDKDIFPFITSSNIACGFHAGDPVHMEKTISLAMSHGVQIGAHPGYPDLQGFGRRSMKIAADELTSILKYQIAAIKGVTESLGGRLIYVKPHGALYNDAVGDFDIAQAVMAAMHAIDDQLFLLGLAGSSMAEWAAEKSIPFVAEAFADRRYEDDGTLRSRSLPGSVLTEPQKATEQVLNIVKQQKVSTYSGSDIPMAAQTICIHGDNPNAVAILRQIDLAFEKNGIQKKAFGQAQ